MPLRAQAQDAPKRLVVPGTFGDKVYEEVKVMATTEQGVKIVHSGGITVVPFASLPKEWQEKYPAPSAPAPPPPAAAAASPGASGAAPVAAPGGFDPTCLVFIKTDSGAGSGFVARADGKTYVYTNAHVLCGEPGCFTKKIVSIKTAAGKVIPVPYEVELSNMVESTEKLEDMARFPIVLKEGEAAYEIGGLNPATAMAQPVVAYGNSQGGDVMTSLDGSILGLGTDRIEISCEIVPGNSGGPVVLKDSRQVVGISTYLTDGDRDIWSSSTRFTQVRRFALRPERVTKWRKMQYTSLMMSLAELAAFDRDTLSLAAACCLNPRPNRGGFDVPSQQNGDFIVRQVLVDGTKHSLGATISEGISRVNGRLAGATGVMAVNDVVPIFATFFSNVASASASQMSNLGSADRVPYIKQFIPALLTVRRKYHDQFIQEGATRFR